MLSWLVFAGFLVALYCFIADPFHDSRAQAVDSYLNTCGCVILKTLAKQPPYEKEVQSRLEVTDLLYTMSGGDAVVCDNILHSMPSAPIVLVDRDGKITGDFSQAVGALGPYVYKYCGRKRIFEVRGPIAL